MTFYDSAGSGSGLSVGGERVMVLLVDDQVMVGEAIRRALAADPGIDFHYCSDPASAVETVKELRPSVILQDLVMPGMDGLELVRAYRREPGISTIPIIVLSTKEDSGVKRDAFQAGANDYLVKLPDEVELIARLHYHSRAYQLQLQRDAAYRALQESQRQLLETNLELQRLTNVDGLTGLSNRRYFSQYIEAEWRRSIRTGDSMAVLMIDVDFFKLYNDNCGHLAGDDVLKRIAGVIQENCRRSSDLGARFGGEEFVMVLAATALDGAAVVADRVRARVAALRMPHPATPGGVITVSIGVAATWPKAGDSFFALIDAADRALYDAKRGGRDRVVQAAA
ncbi:diguanylate cyclase [Pseudoxanthobacter sp.]|uniref:diguanylate cyclase n=1 Tax=Pseudoxanthobacter sp. TaxID=1925742 RepID=UPI002FE311D1